MSSRCSPILNPKSSLSVNTMTNSMSSSSQIRHELSKILLQHDPNAIRLYDFINHVKILFYNTNEFLWENNSSIEGNLFVYERRSIIDNQSRSSYAFAIVNKTQKFMQQITSQISTYSDKLFLFYETVINNKCEVFCLHFVNENECLRLSMFISKTIEYLKNFEKQQSNIVMTNALPCTETKTKNILEKQTLTTGLNSDLSQVNASKKQILNSSNEIRNSALSLKHLLNIQNQNDIHDESIEPDKMSSINLIPPSVFKSTLSTDKLNQALPIQREHVHDILLDLVQNNDHFLNMIHQAYLNCAM